MLPWRRSGNSNHARDISVYVLVISAATAGCSRYPISSVAEADRANLRALQAEAPRYSSVEYQGYQDALRSAQALLAEQQQRWVFRSYDPAVALLEQARKLAELAATKATEERARRRLEVEDELRQFEEALQMIQNGDAGVAQLALVRRSLLKAEISLATAKSQWEAGNYDAASSKLRSEAGAVRFLEEVREAFVRRNTDPRLLTRWNTAVKATIAYSAQKGEHAIIINKYRQTLSLYRAGCRVAEYMADLGSNPFSGKRQHGDEATPEGRYHVVKKLGAGQSRYYKALVINYPNTQDRERYRRLKRYLPSLPGMGGQIEIHGRGGRNQNWTSGCIAVDDRTMDQLFAAAAVGTAVTIVANETLQNLRNAVERN